MAETSQGDRFRWILRDQGTDSSFFFLFFLSDCFSTPSFFEHIPRLRRHHGHVGGCPRRHRTLIINDHSGRSLWRARRDDGRPGRRDQDRVVSGAIDDRLPSWCPPTPMDDHTPSDGGAFSSTIKPPSHPLHNSIASSCRQMVDRHHQVELP